jgi:hypothetical protein
MADFAAQPGESGNPNGRPKGSRNRISEAALKEEFAACTLKLIEVMRKKSGD